MHCCSRIEWQWQCHIYHVVTHWITSQAPCQSHPRPKEPPPHQGVLPRSDAMGNATIRPPYHWPCQWHTLAWRRLGDRAASSHLHQQVPKGFHAVAEHPASGLRLCIHDSLAKFSWPSIHLFDPFRLCLLSFPILSLQKSKSNRRTSTAMVFVHDSKAEKFEGEDW